MSGPKTSELLIERMIAAQLEAWRMDVDDAVAAARRAIIAARDEALARCAGCEGADDEAAAVRAAGDRALARLREECSWMPAIVLEESQERAERCQRSAAAIAEAFRAEMAAAGERLERRAAQQAAAEDATDFMALLAQAFDGGAEAETTETSQSAGAPAADSAQEVARRALALVHSPHTLPADRALLLNHARALADDAAAQLALLLPAMEANERAAGELAASIAAAEAALAAQGVPFPAAGPFATLEEAATHREDLREIQAQADRNTYLQGCIDAVMAAHGYDIARSVSMGRDLSGTHRLFGADGAEAGIHAFLSAQGDLMLQVAGLPEGIEAVAEGEAVALEGAEDSRVGDLVEAQRDFCAVYDEIAEDLAAYGIVNAVRYRAEPDAAFSRDVRPAEAEDGAKDRDAQAADAGQIAGAANVAGAAPYTPDRRRKRSAAAREMR